MIKNFKSKSIIVIAVVVAMLACLTGCGGADTTYADIVIKDYGTVTVELDFESAPITCENFVHLAKEGFMMQGGDPEGNGTGGSGKTIVGEFTSNGHNNPLSHIRGAISMARSNHPDSASSQFFIVHEDSTFLDGQYATFGYVIDGMSVVDEICEAATPTDDNGTIPAAQQPIIEKITIRTE